MKPVNTARVPVAWNNALGVTLTGQGLTATFEPPNPPEHDLQIVVGAEGGLERRYLLSAGAHQRIH
jgi:hypothetical protein